MQRYAMLVIVGSMPYEEEDTFMPDEGEDTYMHAMLVVVGSALFLSWLHKHVCFLSFTNTSQQKQMSKKK